MLSPSVVAASSGGRLRRMDGADRGASGVEGRQAFSAAAPTGQGCSDLRSLRFSVNFGVGSCKGLRLRLLGLEFGVPSFVFGETSTESCILLLFFCCYLVKFRPVGALCRAPTVALCFRHFWGMPISVLLREP